MAKKAFYLGFFVGLIWLGRPVSVLATAVPAPQPVDTPNFLVGAFYMPKMPSLTREWMTLYKWNSDSSRGVTSWPYLGLTSAKDTEAMNWQIKWALEHGISAFIFDWYFHPWAAKPTWDGSLAAFLAASYSSQMKFALFWASSALIKTDQASLDLARSEQYLRQVADYWCDHYFPQANFLRFANRPLIFVDFENFTNSDLSSFGYSQALTVLRDQIRQRGFPEPYFVGLKYIGIGDLSGVPGANAAADRMKSAGFSAFSWYGYYFGTNDLPCELYPSAAGSFFHEMLIKGATAGALKFIPALNAFYETTLQGGDFKCHFNSSGPNLATLFNQAAAATKTEILNQPNGAIDFNGKKLVLIASWNEWWESSNLEPGKRFGGGSDPFSFLKAVRAVFAPSASGESARPAASTGPSSAGPYDLPAQAVDRFVFNNQEEADNWFVRGEASALATQNGRSWSYARPIYDDTWAKMMGNFLFWRGIFLPAVNADQVKVKFSSRCGFNFDQNCQLQAAVLSWTTDQYTGAYANGPFVATATFYNASSAPGMTLTENSELVLNLKSNPAWKDKIQEVVFHFRFFNPPVKFGLEEIIFTPGAFCASCPSDPPKNQGNANCDGKINSLDFALWRSVFLNPAATEPEKAGVDFNCQPGETSHTIDLNDFLVWLNHY